MFIISDAISKAIHAQGLRFLRQQIIARWFDHFRSAANAVTESARSRILAEIDEISIADPALKVADLMMLADLMLIDAANEVRAAQL